MIGISRDNYSHRIYGKKYIDLKSNKVRYLIHNMQHDKITFQVSLLEVKRRIVRVHVGGLS